MCSEDRALFETSINRPTMMLSSPLARHPFAIGAKDKAINKFTSVDTQREESIDNYCNNQDICENKNYVDDNNYTL